MRVAVIGGGPAGLTTLKYLVTAHKFFDDIEPIEARPFEASSSVGGTFRYRTYEHAEVIHFFCLFMLCLTSAIDGFIETAHHILRLPRPRGV